MRITATRRLQYAIGHRVYNHESKCRNLHGHNFVFFLTAEGTSDPQDTLGRVIDFGVLKEKLGTWLECHWDHGMLLWEGDEALIAGVRYAGGQKLFLLPYNPTAENMCKYLLEIVGPKVLEGTRVRLVKVTIHETENGIAEVSL